jgi:hypothetical protein
LSDANSSGKTLFVRLKLTFQILQFNKADVADLGNWQQRFLIKLNINNQYPEEKFQIVTIFLF